jgi:hypothetical protein
MRFLALFLFAATALAQEEPRPILQLSPASIDFGSAYVNKSSTMQRLVLINWGERDLRLVKFIISGPLHGFQGIKAKEDHLAFAFTSHCAEELAPHKSCYIDLWFTPLVRGRDAANLVVISNDISQPHLVYLFGRGVR